MNVSNLVGQTLDDKYSIQQEIGRGGMGAVYLAVHLGTKRPVAVKVIVPQFMQRAEFVERFKREAEAAGRLHHPNVVDVTDFGFAMTGEGRVAYLVMEYLNGCTLGEILTEERKLPLLWSVDILEQVCSAVHEAHRQGIIHRDLKPDNIWLEPNQRGGYTVKVLDFGIAKLEAPSQQYTAETLGINPQISGNQPQSPANNQAQTEMLPAPDKADEPTINGFDTFIENPPANYFPKPEHGLTLPANVANNTPASNDKSQAETLQDYGTNGNAPHVNDTDRKSLYQQSTADITMVGAIMGTPLYMSPEQCRAERLSPISDIYSIGVIAYQMLSGKTPFQGENISVISGHLQSPQPKLHARGVPRKVKKVIYQALAKDPYDRPHTAEIFSSQLRSHSESIINIFRRALVIFIENFSKLIWFSLLLYFPTILFAAASFIINILKFNGVFSSNILSIASTVVLSFLKHLNIAAGVAAETLVIGAVTWIVVQYIDAPLRSFRVTRAFAALFEKWKQFAWIIPLRIVINLIIQGDLIAFSPPIVFILSLLETLAFWALPAVVMLENLGGMTALKRGWQLTTKAIPTVLAATFINLFIFLIIGVSSTIIVVNLGAALSQALFPAAMELSLEDFTNLVSGASITFIKFIGAILLPFFGVVWSLIYLKTRHAGGESMKVLLDKFKAGEILQSNWQKRIRTRSLLYYKTEK